MAESTFDVGDLNSLIDNISAQAAPWYSAISGTTVVPLPTSQGQAAAQQLQIQQQAQAKLAQTNPTLAGTLGSPTVILIIVGVLGLIALFLLLR